MGGWALRAVPSAAAAPRVGRVMLMRPGYGAPPRARDIGVPCALSMPAFLGPLMGGPAQFQVQLDRASASGPGLSPKPRRPYIWHHIYRSSPRLGILFAYALGLFQVR